MSGNPMISDILADAINAPSGDNAQPWRFRIQGDEITIFNVAESDATLYNFRQRGSYLGHGALVENIAIAASERGYTASITPFPGEKDVTAKVVLAKGGVSQDPLFPALDQRVTNRKPYDGAPLGVEDTTALVGAAHERGHELRFVAEKDQVTKLSTALSLNERLLMEHRPLHNFLFGMIRWTEAEEKAKPGLYVKTMEFPPPVQILLKYVVKHWAAVQWLNKIGLSHAIPKQSAQLYASSSAFGAIIIRDDSNTSFFDGGRALERVWLTATKRGLAMQPVTALPYLMQRIEAGETETLSKEHIELIRAAYDHIARAFHLSGSDRIAMLFRIGRGEEPTARSAKLAPVIF